MFGRATIRLGIGPHSSFLFFTVARDRDSDSERLLYFGAVVCSSFFLSSFFSSPNLSGRRLDVYHTLAHDVALVRI